jgi:transposase-like protein
MTITIDSTCPPCHSLTISRNGKKNKGKQNYLCKDCGRPFIGDQQMTYRGCFSWMVSVVNSMLVRGMGISIVLKIRITKVLKTFISTKHEIQPKFSPHDCFEIDEFWTYEGKKKNNVRLI